MRKTHDNARADQRVLQEAIERKAAELRSLGLGDDEIKRATDPLRSFYLDGEHPSPPAGNPKRP